MKVCILTTDTVHHRYFIKELQKTINIDFIIFETRKLEFDYETHHSFENLQENFENEYLFNGQLDKFEFNTSTFTFKSINDQKTIDLIKQLNPDIGLVFGCGRIDEKVFSLFPNNLINVHRGISRFYRGLDSDYWAVFNKDFKNIGVTLHYIDKNLDTGNILYEGRISLPIHSEIHELRGRTTKLATDNMLLLMKSILNLENIKTESQLPGKYYTAMSTGEKNIAKKIYNEHFKGS